MDKRNLRASARRVRLACITVSLLLAVVISVFALTTSGNFMAKSILFTLAFLSGIFFVICAADVYFVNPAARRKVRKIINEINQDVDSGLFCRGQTLRSDDVEMIDNALGYPIPETYAIFLKTCKGELVLNCRSEVINGKLWILGHKSLMKTLGMRKSGLSMPDDYLVISQLNGTIYAIKLSDDSMPLPWLGESYVVRWCLEDGQCGCYRTFADFLEEKWKEHKRLQIEKESMPLAL